MWSVLGASLDVCVCACVCAGFAYLTYCTQDVDFQRYIALTILAFCTGTSKKRVSFWPCLFGRLFAHSLIWPFVAVERSPAPGECGSASFKRAPPTLFFLFKVLTYINRDCYYRRDKVCCDIESFNVKSEESFMNTR